MKIILKKRDNVLAEFDKKNLSNAVESYDGIVFEFKNGLLISYSDNNMPVITKSIIKNSVLKDIVSGNLIVDFANYTRPVFFEMN